MKRERSTIYVALLDEGLEVWRPVEARSLGGGTYLILEQDYDRSLETWEFGPGAVVKCRTDDRDGRRIKIAVERLPQSAFG